MDKIDFILAGVGGQGIVLMGDLLAETAMAAGYDVKKSDIHGMAQRGGSVVSYVRLAGRVWSPLPKTGEVDFLVGLEKLETARWASQLHQDGVAIVNDHSILPLSVSSGVDPYPTDAQILGSLHARTDLVHWVDGTVLATGLGNPKVVNVVLLGFLASLLPMSWEVWLSTIERRVPARYRDLNVRALEAGRKAAEGRSALMIVAE